MHIRSFRCFSINPADRFYLPSLSHSYPMARHLLADLLISEVFPTLLSKCRIDDIHDLLNYSFQKPWKVPKIDSFLDTFFTDYLPSSIKLQSVFRVDTHSSMIAWYLKAPSTRLKRVHQLIDQVDKVFFLHEIVQRVVLRSGEYQTLIDQLIEDGHCLTVEKLSNEKMKLPNYLMTTTGNIKQPGFHIDTLNNSFYYLTGKQQEHLTKIILHDFIQVRWLLEIILEINLWCVLLGWRRDQSK